MSVQEWSYIVYLPVILGWLVLELLGLAHRKGLPVPWFTMSEMVWKLIDRRPWARALVAVFFLSVASHFAFHTPLLP